MNLLRHIAMDGLRRTPQKSIGVISILMLASALIASTILSLPILWHDSAEQIKNISGNWHGGFKQSLTQEQVIQLRQAPEVKALGLSTDLKIAQSEGYDRPFMLFQNHNATYWENHFPVSQVLSAGRVPTQPDEIIISQQMLEATGLQLGDSLSVTFGNRELSDGFVLSPNSTRYPDESFVTDGTPPTNLTIVGVGNVKMSSPSSKPFYEAFGFFSDDMIAASSPLYAKIEIRNPVRTYQILPQLAQQLGFEPQHAEDPTLFIYNHDLLTNAYAATPPATLGKGVLEVVKYHFVTFTSVFIVVIVCLLFFVLINTAFKAWHLERLRDWGLLKSVGATPRQTRQTIFWESVYLALPTSLFGLVIGYGLLRYLFYQLDQLAHISDRLLSYLSPFVFLFAGFVSFSIIMLANMRVAKILSHRATLDLLNNRPLDGIISHKNRKRRLRSSEENIHWHLPKQSLHHHRSYFRTANLSLLLTFLLLFAVSTFLATHMAANEQYFNDLAEKPQINIMHFSGEPLPETVQHEIVSLPGIERYMAYRQLQVGIRLPKSAVDTAYHEAGGFAAFTQGLYNVKDAGDYWQMTALLYALPQDLYHSFCQEVELAPEATGPQAVPILLYNLLPDPATNPDALTSAPLLPATNLQAGDRLSGRENVHDEEPGNHMFDLQITAVTDRLPYAIADDRRIHLTGILPYEHFDALTQHLTPDKEVRSNTTKLMLRVDPNRESALYEEIQIYMQKYFPESDYQMTSVSEMRKASSASLHMLFKLNAFLCVFLAFFGLISAAATIRQSMLLRQHDFALLRSVGMDPDALRGLLLREALLFFAKPFFIAIILALLFGGLMMWNTKIAPSLILPYLPWPLLIAFILGILVVILMTYEFNLRRFTRQTIISQLRSDTLH